MRCSLSPTSIGEMVPVSRPAAPAESIELDPNLPGLRLSGVYANNGRAAEPRVLARRRVAGRVSERERFFVYGAIRGAEQEWDSLKSGASGPRSSSRTFDFNASPWHRRRGRAMTATAAPEALRIDSRLFRLLGISPARHRTNRFDRQTRSAEAVRRPGISRPSSTAIACVRQE